MHDAGMKTENRRGVYTTIEKAKEAKERILTRWGNAERKDGKPRSGASAAKSALAAKDAEIEALKAEIAAIKAALAK